MILSKPGHRASLPGLVLVLDISPAACYTIFESIIHERMITMDKLTLASKIDHTLLKPEATQEQILKICAEAREYHFASVCVNTTWADTVTEALRGSGVKTCCVVGFPLGAMSTEAKCAETKYAVEHGAGEVDMVINIGWAKAGLFEEVGTEIAAIVKAAAPAKVKVIIETCLLTDEEKIAVCRAAARAGAEFVKTSTGFSTGGATEADVRLMKEVSGIKVKASGGIRDYDTAMKMLSAGADRIGASAGIAIVNSCTD